MLARHMANNCPVDLVSAEAVPGVAAEVAVEILNQTAMTTSSDVKLSHLSPVQTNWNSARNQLPSATSETFEHYSLGLSRFFHWTRCA
jgi:hypothetical protein